MPLINFPHHSSRGDACFDLELFTLSLISVPMSPAKIFAQVSSLRDTMPASREQTSNVRQAPKKLRSACDNCHQGKVKCSGGQPGEKCEKCEKGGLSCVYSVSNRIGRPRNSRNDKTLERIRRSQQDQESPRSTASEEAERSEHRTSSSVTPISENIEDPLLTHDLDAAGVRLSSTSRDEALLSHNSASLYQTSSHENFGSFSPFPSYSTSLPLLGFEGSDEPEYMEDVFNVEVSCSPLSDGHKFGLGAYPHCPSRTMHLSHLL